ncbi:MAG TPA: hypothetical protein DD636_08695 [Anaerolineaceae bacterium]|nr:hypothetical protein [Anaerolineaceae bacterium]
MIFEKARNFIYKNARPLDFARWNYLFENGSKEDVLSTLMTDQNEDGGFGHSLEPDCWNPNSSPVQTWVATRIINEVNLEDKSHPIIQGILKYLGSGVHYDGHTWANSIPTNDDYPHAPWWSFDPDSDPTYNPTASLVGFILKFGDQNSELFDMAAVLVREAYAHFKLHHPLEQMHTVACFVELYEDLKTSSIIDLIDMEEFKKLLHTQIQHVLTHDTSRWAVDYVCKPSLFIQTKDSDFYLANLYTCYYECEFIANTQEADGTWAVTWAWADYPEEWHISKNWWKSDLIIRNLKYLQAMCG